jgi:hypothetical protein
MKYFESKDIKFVEGQIAKDLIDTEGRKTIHAAVKKGFESGNVSLSTEMTGEKLVKYIPGLVSNHLRKDKRLNGGKQYEPTESGKFTGNSNPQIREMRKLVKALDGKPQQLVVQAKLNEMINAWKAKNGVKTVEIDTDLIPAEFRALVG